MRVPVPGGAGDRAGARLRGVGAGDLLAREATRRRPPANGLGRAAHSLLEWSARNGWSEPGADRIDSALAREGAAGAEARARDAVVAWLGSDLLAELRDGGATFRPEVPFGSSSERTRCCAALSTCWWRRAG